MRKLLLSVALVLAFVSPAKAQTPFYQGKTITIVVGYLAGECGDHLATARN